MKLSCRHIFIFLSAVAGLTLASCGGDDRVWTKSINLPGEKWDADKKLVFTPDTLDIEGKRPERLILFVRYAGYAGLKDLPVLVETESNVKGFELTLDTVTFHLFDDRSFPLGHGTYGVYEEADTFNLRNPAEPGWSIAIGLPTMNEPAKGIIAFGVTLLE